MSLFNLLNAFAVNEAVIIVYEINKPIAAPLASYFRIKKYEHVPPIISATK